MPILYTPIVKGKENDLKAIGKMPRVLIEKMLPIVELLSPDKGEDLDQSYVRFGGQLRKHCPFQTFSVDLHSIAPEQRTRNGDPALEELCAYLRGVGVPFLPVFGFDHEPELWDRIARIAQREGRGLTFRLKIEDLEATDETLSEVVARLRSAKIPPKLANLVIDLWSVAELDLAELAQRRELVQDFIAAGMAAADFGLISIVGSSMPKDVGGVPRDGNLAFPRRELPLWLDTMAALPRVPLAFGDYGVIHPNFSAKNPATNANGKIRYTTRLQHHIFRGHSLQQGLKYEQYFDLAQRVVSSQIYLGRDYSYGDERTWRCANRQAGTGHLGTWVESDMNHHLVLVSAQLRQIMSNLAAGVPASEVLTMAE